MIKTVSSSVFVILAYFVFAKIGLLAAFDQINTSPVWPPTGLAIAASLYLGPKIFPSIFIGAFLVNLHVSGNAFAASSLIATGNTLEAIFAYVIITQYAHINPFNKLSHVLIFALALVTGTAVGATIGVSSLYLFNLTEFSLVPLLWLTWWTGDLVGGLTLTPLFMVWLPKHYRTEKFSLIEVFVGLTGFLICAFFVFGNFTPNFINTYPFTFLFLPFLVWVALRCKLKMTTLFVFIFSLIAILGTLQGHGPFVQTSITQSLILLQGFIATIALISLALAASEAERQLFEKESKRINAKLEKHVKRRTRELNATNAMLTNELKQKAHTATALENILTATALNSDDEFYQTTVKNLAETFITKFAFMGIFADQQKTKIKTLAVWAGDNWAENFEYDLQGTPCSDVLSHQLECILTNAKNLYPSDELLQKMSIDSYLGAPLIDPDKQTMGIIAVMDVKPIVILDWYKPVFALFANRIAAELSKIPIEREMKLAAGVFHESIDAIIIVDNKNTILRINPAFTRVTGYSELEMVGKHASILRTRHYGDEFYNSFWQTLICDGFWTGELMLEHKNGHNFPSYQTITSVRDQNGKVQQLISIFSDITEKKESENKLYRLAHFDLITHLPNRTSFHLQLNKSIKLAKRQDSFISLLFLDIDNFKLINDSLGHSYGDMLLKIIADRLITVVREIDTVSRLGGDEFTVILSNISSNEDAAIVAQKLLSSLNEPIWLDHHEVMVTVSIGIANYPTDGDSVETLLKFADSAMYSAKERGKNNFQFYTKQMHVLAMHKLTIEKSLKSAIEKNEFYLHYQPQVDVMTGEIVSCEALIRWEHPKLGNIPPNEFISIAEECGFIVALGDWVIDIACQQLNQWNELNVTPVRIAINLSGRQLIDNNFATKVIDKIKQYHLKTSLIELELTESILMEQHSHTILMLKELRDSGVHLSIDDFGTGYSSMAYLKRFPINKLKIDRSFVQNLGNDHDDGAIVNAIIALGHSLKLGIIAEGVEFKHQLDFLRDNNCNEVQGYFFSKPLPSDEMTKLLMESRSYRNLI